MLKFIFLIFNLFNSIESLNIYSQNTINNIEYINNHNKNNKSYDLEVNQFIYNKYNNEYNVNKSHIKLNNNYTNIENFKDIKYVPYNLDWRKSNKVSSVKNQLNCGSCWAFSTAEAIESAWAIKHNKLYNLSEQELVDCSHNYGNNGCEGGSMDNGFKYVIDNGLCTNESYPYIAKENQCLNNECESVVSIKNYTDVQNNDEKILKKAVTINPVSVAIQANKRSFQFYKSGIYTDIDCGFELDHGVLLIGYGYDLLNNLDYWIIKNSWGESWGENGYIRIQRNIDDERGLCGVAMMPSFPIL